MILHFILAYATTLIYLCEKPTRRRAASTHFTSLDSKRCGATCSPTISNIFTRQPSHHAISPKRISELLPVCAWLTLIGSFALPQFCVILQWHLFSAANICLFDYCINLLVVMACFWFNKPLDCILHTLPVMVLAMDHSEERPLI